jgi:hypothetical protein
MWLFYSIFLTSSSLILKSIFFMYALQRRGRKTDVVDNLTRLRQLADDYEVIDFPFKSFSMFIVFLTVITSLGLAAASVTENCYVFSGLHIAHNLVFRAFISIHTEPIPDKLYFLEQPF